MHSGLRGHITIDGETITGKSCYFVTIFGRFVFGKGGTVETLSPIPVSTSKDGVVYSKAPLANCGMIDSGDSVCCLGHSI